MSSQDISKFLEHLCSTSFGGGRIIVSNAETILIYDVPSWPGERTDALRQRWPQCSVDLHQAQNISVSGFVVVVSINKPVGYFKVFVSLTATILLAILTGFTAMTVFLSEHPDWRDLSFYSLPNNDTCMNNDTGYD